MSADLSETLDYLRSPAAHASLDANVYWSKWASPWWRLSLLYEMGEIRQAPAAIIEHLVEALAKSPLTIFPIHPHELPSGADPYLATHCHCALGNIYQVLSAWGVDVDASLPWIRAWFLRYQMADGGMNCDEGAYLVEGECPSSMVAIISPFEAVVRYTRRPYTSEELRFLEKAAGFLIGRTLNQGSNTLYNAAEQKSAQAWPALCFPRFYLYDTLRGLRALLEWADKLGAKVPRAAVQPVVDDLRSRFPDGQIRLGRRSYAGVGTRRQNEQGAWVRTPEADSFPLLQAVSAVGEVSPYLSADWATLQPLLTKVVEAH
ncbi:MAG: hypothetical protein U1E65_21155 [Myxococcota bacterium]